jgi:hypothetical protein
MGSLGTGSVFAADGALATSTSDTSSSGDPSDSGCGAAPSAGAGPLGVTSTSGTAPVFAGGRVRLATALGTTGLAGIIGVPAPGSLSTCNIPGSLATGMDSPGLRPLSGMTPPNTC